MAIIKMKPFMLIGLLKDRKTILETLQKLECVQVSKTENMPKVQPYKQISQMDSMIADTDAAIYAIERYDVSKKAIFASKRLENKSKLQSDFIKNNNAYKTSRLILNIMHQINNHKNRISKLETESKLLYYYLDLDLPPNIKDTVYTNILIGNIPGFWDTDSITQKIGKDVHIEIINANKIQTSAFFIIPKCIYDNTKKTLLDMGFSYSPFTFTEQTPKEKLQEYKNKIQKSYDKIAIYEQKIKNLASHKYNIQLFSDQLRLRKEKYETICKLGLTEHTFILQGFLNPTFETKLKKQLKPFDLYIESSDACENSPVAFSNGFFSSPVESITETYSMPSSEDIDPNPIMSFFYYLFFGMMFSDAGYGLLMVLVCGWLAFIKKWEPKKKKTFRMFFFCGISTMFWGFMYGSFFGNAIDTVAKAFFNINFSIAPIWINTVSEPLTLLIFSISLGLMQIIIGLCLKLYSLLKHGKIMEALSNTAGWIGILLGIGIFSIGLYISMNALTTIGIVLIALGAILIILLGGYQKKGFMRVFGGLIGLYDITSYISDILSYSRLMALGIATGVIANVINILGSMAGGGFIGIVVFILVSLVGHAMNFGINMLGAYVHTNRLQYVEFFSKFYEGGGKKFSPLGMHTKYIQFLGEIK